MLNGRRTLQGDTFGCGESGTESGRRFRRASLPSVPALADKQYPSPAPRRPEFLCPQS